jgi:beta-lactamase class A
MEIRQTNDVRYVLAALIALPVVIAIAIPLYLSGTPSLLAQPDAPTATAVAHVAAVTQPAQQTVGGHPTQEANDEPNATSEPEPLQNEDVVAVVDRLLADQTGIFGINIEEPGKDPDYRLNADLPFLSASLYKLVLLADVYDGIERGTIATDQQVTLQPDYFPGPDEPVDSFYTEESISSSVDISEALFATGAYSSNVAAHALLSLTDEMSLEATARELGMTKTYFYVDPRDLPEWPPTDVQSGDPETLATAVAFTEAQAVAGPLMLTTPRDMATYFDKLLNDEVINPSVSGLILGILKQQAVDDRFPCLLPLETEIAHKTGNLDHVVHDVGVIWTPDGPVILIAMIEDAEDDAVASRLIQQLALVAYNDLDDPALAVDATPDESCGA